MKLTLCKSMAFLFLMGTIANISNGDALKESPKTLKVLLVGNSQCPTIVGNQLLEKLAASDKGGTLIKVGGCIKGGASLKSHWEAGTVKGSAREMIGSGNWDFIVLQDIYNVQEPAFQPYARLFNDLIKKTGKQTILFGTASILSDFPKGFERQHRLHLNMGKELGPQLLIQAKHTSNTLAPTHPKKKWKVYSQKTKHTLASGDLIFIHAASTVW